MIPHFFFFIDKSDNRSYDQQTQTSTPSDTPKTWRSLQKLFTPYWIKQEPKSCCRTPITQITNPPRNLKTKMYETSKELRHIRYELWTETVVLSEEILCVV